MRLWFKFVTPVVVTALLATGCSFGGGDKGPDKNEPSTLKVMYYDESQFYQDYGMVFSALYPNIEIEVITTQGLYNGEEQDYEAAYNKFIEEKQPDIFMLGGEQYKKFAQDGKLADLDTLIEKEKYNTEGLIPGLMEYLREEGGGRIYALAPNFWSQVIYYNKDLFDKYNIEYPKDRMSWSETLQLARSFPTEGDPKERVYGLKIGYNDDLFQMASTFAAAEGISFVNAAQKQVNINSDSWKNVFQTALDALSSKSLYYDSIRYEQQNDNNANNTYEDYLLADPFISGRLAMMIGDSNYVNQIKQASNNEKVKDQVVKNWDLVTVPVGQQHPDQSSMMFFHNLLAINANATNKEDAWKLLSYLSSDEYARVKSKTNNYNGMPVRTKYIGDTDGRNYAAYYNLKPSNFNAYKDYDKLPQSFWGDFNGAVQTELQKVKEDKQSLSAALELLQVKGQEMIEKEDPVKDDSVQGEQGASSESITVPVQVESSN